MDFSLIICTYNRAKSLKRTLEICRQLSIPPGVAWELLVVDNNSTDHTDQVCECFTSDIPLRCIVEPRQGLSHARNRGVQESTGELVLFTDDDVDVDPYWLARLDKAAREHPDAAFFGGPIVPRWERKPPAWITRHANDVLRSVAMNFDLGRESRFLAVGESPFWGANMAFRRSVLSDDKVFDPRLGYNGKDLTPHEETNLMKSLMQQGLRGYYVPDAVVYHRNSSSRATERFVRRWFAGVGMAEVRLEYGENVAHEWGGVPRYLWRRVIESGIRYVLTRWTRSSVVWLSQEVAMAKGWGMICEHRRRAKAKES